MILQAVISGVIGGLFASFVACARWVSAGFGLVFGASLEAARRVVVGMSGG